MARQATRRQVIGAAYQAMGQLIDMSPSNPANMARLALIDRPRVAGLRVIRDALLLMEDGLRDEALEDLDRLNALLDVEVDRIRARSA